LTFVDDMSLITGSWNKDIVNGQKPLSEQYSGNMDIIMD